MQPTHHSINEITDRRNAYINQFRKTGIQKLSKIEGIIQAIQNYLWNSEGNNHALALFEWATMVRIGNQYEKAISIYEQCIEEAETCKNHELLFDCYIGIARAHIYGTRKHGEGAYAFKKAVQIAGNNPTKKQQYEMADYESQMLGGRGELKAALLRGLEAIDLASDNSELFYAQLDVADVLQKFAESCDYRKLIDSKSGDDPDPYGACKRAVSSANNYFVSARQTAQNLGWDFLVKEANGFISRLNTRLFLINSKASFESSGVQSIFNASEVEDVLVNDNFEAGASALQDMQILGRLIAEIVPGEETSNPRNLYLLGIKADLEKNEDLAIKYFQQAVEHLYEERKSYFDTRQRGTTIENRGELVRDLALRLLAMGENDKAFWALESVRANGLSGLMSIYEQIPLFEHERKLLSTLIELESQKSSMESSLTMRIIAGEDFNNFSIELEKLLNIKNRIQVLSLENITEQLINKIKKAEVIAPTQNQFSEEVRKANIPVVFYWITHTNVLTWVISPEGIDIKTVFLPETALHKKIKDLAISVDSPFKNIDKKTSTELYTYLIAPFKHLLNHKQLIIVPQGDLVNLPFEALLNSQNNKYLVEELAVSYSPNATFAFKTLRNEIKKCTSIKAVYDDVEAEKTGEIKGISQYPELKVKAISGKDLDKNSFTDILDENECVHLLLHGKFNNEDPLQSTLAINSSTKLTAAELLSINWKNTRLTVFSSCESGMVNTRISNEIYGFSWPLLAGGTDNILLSRWRVSSSHNAAWMETFYHALINENLSPAFASRKAMLNLMIANRDKPYYWAGPQTYGR